MTYGQADNYCYDGRNHEDILSVRWGGIRLYDQYLSPLQYKWQFIALQNEWWQNLSVSDWSHVGKIKLQGAMLYNVSYSNMIYALGLQGGWGAQYNFERLIQVKGLNIFLGPYLDLDLFAKDHLSNANKPLSIDLCLDVKAHVGVSYSFAAKNTSYRLRYTALTSLIGAQFVSEYGHSYYEITEGIIGGTIGLSSLHNRLSIRHELTFDMQFRHSAWRVGVEHEYIRHEMNGLHFQREQVSLVVGTIFNYRTSIKKFR